MYYGYASLSNKYQKAFTLGRLCKYKACNVLERTKI